MDISKIIEKLETKYQNTGFSKKAFTGVAEYAATVLSDDAKDSDIDNFIDGVEPLLKSFQGDVDSRVQSAAQKAKKDLLKSLKEGEQDDGGDPKPKPEPKPDDNNMPAWAQALVNQNKELAKGLSELRTDKVSSTRKQQLEKKLTDAPGLFKKTVLKHFNPNTFESDEDFKEYLGGLDADIKEAKQEISNNKLGSQSRPNIGNGGKDGKEASEEDVRDVVNQIM